METTEKTTITVEAEVNAPVEKVWKFWTEPDHITKWNHANDDWHSPWAENDLQAGGKFRARMEAKDGSMGFDFEGTYTEIKEHELIAYTLDDDRKVKILFKQQNGKTVVTESFEAEQTHSIDLQREGWQAILNNFKKYAEKPGELKRRHYEIEINAKPENVYKVMLEESSYKEWTKEFNASSYYKGSWEKGSKILFIGTDENGAEGGMVSRINENIPAQFVSIEHLGVLHGNKEITSGPEVQGWAGALENYSFKAVDEGTLLSIDIDINEEYLSYFDDAWPKALQKLKAMCEG